MSETLELVRYDAMCRAIAEAEAVDEVKDIRDKALALEAYARQAMNTEAEEQARRIRIRAERRVGELLRGLPRATPQTANPGGRPVSDGPTRVQTPYAKALADNRLSRQQANEFERLAEVPEDLFEKELETQGSPTAATIIHVHKPVVTPVSPVSPEALWLWGRLHEFEREGVLGRPPQEIMAAMTPPMQVDALRLAPRVADWLGQIGREDDAENERRAAAS